MAFLLRNLLPTSLLTSLILSSSLILATTAIASQASVGIALPPVKVSEEATQAEDTEPAASPKNEAEAAEPGEDTEETAPDAKEKEIEQAAQDNNTEETAQEEETEQTSQGTETDPATKTVPPTQGEPEPSPQESATEDLTTVPVAFPKAGITLIPPADFAPANLFDGFQQEASQSSIMVLSFPAPTTAMLQAFGDEESLSQKGMTLVSQEAINISGQPGLLVQLEQDAHGRTFSKWILIFGTENQTTIINANFPQELAEELSAPIKASLLSTQVDDSLIASPPEETSDFSITPTDGMALALEISGTLLYSEGGELNGDDPTVPLFIVSPSFSDVLALDQGKFARDRLQQTEQVEAIEILTEAPITINDLEGYEITATAQDLKSATPLLLYQTILFAEDRYYIMQGFVGETGGGEDMADFKAMAESFQHK